LESDHLILGPQVAAFEDRMCAWLHMSGYGVAVNSGTDALAIALRALGVGIGDEVITVANTAVATVSAIRMTGATPVFCDVDPATLTMDPADLVRRITWNTRVILPVHLFGNAADIQAIRAIAQEHALRIVEDCAQSLGTTVRGRATGTWGDIGCFSFYPTKNLGAYGDAGLCFTKDVALAQAMRELRNYGYGPGQIARREGVNSRLDEIQAAILEVKLNHLPEQLAGRRRVAEQYIRQLSPRWNVVQTTEGAQHSFHLFVVLARQREMVMERLAGAGIEAGVHYPTPIHLMPAYSFLGLGPGSLPVTEDAAKRVLSLPCYPELGNDAIEEVCGLLNQLIQEE
jgi:dTDP-4-amino-4,6-dideoxygalactose transaminase